MTPRQRRAAAYHEAGHAVVGVALRLNVRTAQVRRADGELGHTLHAALGRRYGGDWPPDDRVHRELQAALAGNIAHKLAVGRYDNRGAKADYEYAGDLAMHLSSGPGATASLIREAERSTQALVERHWSAIVAVAEELIRAGGVDRAFIVAAIQKAHGSR